MGIFIGATLCAATDANDYFGPIKIPGSMSVPATIKKHRDKMQEERDADITAAPAGFTGSMVPNDIDLTSHVHRPMVGVLASVAILDSNGRPIYLQDEKAPVKRGKVALPLINYLTATFPDQFGTSLRFNDAQPTEVFFGFNLKQIFRIAAFEVLQRNLEPDLNVSVPVRLWHNPVGVYDVADVLIATCDQRDMDLYSALRYFGISADATALRSNALVQATTSHLLARAAQLA